MKSRASLFRALNDSLVLSLATGSLLAGMPAMAAHHHKHARHDKSKAAASEEVHGKKAAHSHPQASQTHLRQMHHKMGHRHAASTHHAATAGVVAAAGTGAAAAVTGASPAAPTAEQSQTSPADKGTNTGLPLPRFAAFRADKVYMRRGPGDRYPIDWVYHRRGLPVEVEREFDVWRLVEDSDGQKGWVHQATLYGSRTFVIPGLPPEGISAQSGEASAQAGDHIGRADARVLGTLPTQTEARARKNDVLLMSHPEDDSSVVAVLQPGTVGNIKLCPQAFQWCRVVVKGYDGWLPRRLFWGLLPGETIQPN